MGKVKQMFEWLTWSIVGVLGMVIFVYVFGVGAVTIYRNQNLGEQMRTVLADADNGVDVSYSKGRRVK